MRDHHVGHAQMAEALGTTVSTMRAWLYMGVTPSSCAVRLMDLIEEKPQVRPWLGLTKSWKYAPRGKLLPPGHPYRFGDPRRPQALAAARARREAA